MKKLLKSWSGSSRDGQGPAASADPALRRAVLDDIEALGSGWFWATDAAGTLVYISPFAADRFGLAPADLLGQPFASLFETDPETCDKRADRPLQFRLSSRARIEDLIVRLVPGLAPGRRTGWWSLTAQPKVDERGALLGFRGIARDVTVEHDRRIEESRLAEFDSLTGLANRHRMGRRLDQVLAAYKAANRACALMMLDLDRFKQVNDTLGHQAGDELLRDVGIRLSRVIGDRGEIGRLGGDEFQIILPDLDDRGKLGELAGQVIGILSQPYELAAGHAAIGTSVGIAVAPYDGIESEDLVRAADLALYAAKNGGRGAFRFYSADLRDEKEERRTIEQDLRDALALIQTGEGEPLSLLYQPVVRAADDIVVGFEALMRWDHPDRGLLEPEAFLPVAEDCDLIGPLGEWSLRRACADAGAWPQNVRLAVNISAVQFARAGFPDLVAEVLADSNLSPDRLELELTEAVFMGESGQVEETFRALKALGVRLALDDFGTGYSSLSYLRAAPFDKLKVDRSFVETSTLKDNNSAKIIAAIIGLSDALGMDTVVEGVEAFDQFHLVRGMGARLVQGFLYSAPLAQEVVIERMQAEVFRIAPEGPERHRPDRRSVFRRIGVIHDDHRYEAVMRDLSATGARIDGLVGVPEGTGLVLDLGAGQLAVCTVVRSQDTLIGVEFETPLVSDGAGGLVTRHRISPYALAAAGMPLGALPGGRYPALPGTPPPRGKPQFLEVAVKGGR